MFPTPAYDRRGFVSQPFGDDAVHELHAALERVLPIA